jgi:hypothetical protein
MNAEKYAAYRLARSTLIEYIKLKTDEADWRGVSDAANDLRVMEAVHKAENLIVGLR